MRGFFQIGYLSGAGLLAVNGGAIEEYRVNALFLYNLTQFIEWPAEAFKDATDPLTICVLEPNPFERGELEQALAGKRIDRHPLATRMISDPHQSAGCHIVFVKRGGGETGAGANGGDHGGQINRGRESGIRGQRRSGGGCPSARNF